MFLQARWVKLSIIPVAIVLLIASRSSDPQLIDVSPVGNLDLKDVYSPVRLLRSQSHLCNA
jgi:hypothetical protein